MTQLEVLMPTYRHAAFVEQAMDSVLGQRTRDVQVRLLISDDGSDDDTPVILQRYAQRYPQQISLRLRNAATKKDQQDTLPGRDSLIAHYRWATAEYIGLLEGDDYYIDPDKLQDQVDHLRANPHLSFNATNAYNEYEDDRREDYVRGFLGGNFPEKELAQSDIVSANFVPTAGVVFRLDRFPAIPRPFHTVAALDWILYIALTDHGGFQLLNRYSAVRRVHAGGVISMKDPLLKCDRNLHLLQEINSMTAGRYGHLIAQRRIELCRLALQRAVDIGQPKRGAPYLRALHAEPSWRQQAGLRERMRSYVLVHHPSLARVLHRLLA
jgi:glycosyltransferase involved in cell wall biosynthesis